MSRPRFEQDNQDRSQAPRSCLFCLLFSLVSFLFLFWRLILFLSATLHFLSVMETRRASKWAEVGQTWDRSYLQSSQFETNVRQKLLAVIIVSNKPLPEPAQNLATCSVIIFHPEDYCNFTSRKFRCEDGEAAKNSNIAAAIICTGSSTVLPQNPTVPSRDQERPGFHGTAVRSQQPDTNPRLEPDDPTHSHNTPRQWVQKASETLGFCPQPTRPIPRKFSIIFSRREDAKSYNPVHSVTCSHFNITLPSILRSPKWTSSLQVVRLKLCNMLHAPPIPSLI
jgi:hypothetical protein